MIKTTCVSRIPEYVRAHRGNGHLVGHGQPPPPPSSPPSPSPSPSFLPLRAIRGVPRDRSRPERDALLVCSAAWLLPTPQVVRNEAAKKRSRGGETDGARCRESKGVEGEWKTVRYRPFPGPLSIATPSRLRLRHVICATVGSWNFVSPKITPARGPSKEGRERRDATRCAAFPPSWTRNPGAGSSLAGWHRHHYQPTNGPPRPSVCKRADRRRQSVNRAHTWPIAVRYMHLYGVYPKTRASLVAKKRDGCCGRFRGIRHYQANVRGKLTVVESLVRFESRRS